MGGNGHQVIADSALGHNESNDLILGLKDQPAAQREQKGLEYREFPNGNSPTITNDPISKNSIDFIGEGNTLDGESGISAA